MSKIKILGGLVVALLLILATLSTIITQKNRKNMALFEQINRQKIFTQEVAKSVLYLYNRKDKSSTILEETIQKFLDKESRLIDSNREMSQLWNNFYLKVTKFQEMERYKTPYSSLMLERIVNEIYNLNIELIVQFDKLMESRERAYREGLEFHKSIQRGLFFLLILLLLYLFTQVHEIMEFIHKFYNTSKDIREKSSIKGATPLKIDTKEKKLQDITQNYNYLLNRINSSIKTADKSIDISIRAIEDIEQNIEDFMELIAIMEDKRSDELFRKEDKIIDSLETLISLKDRLKILGKNLNELIVPN